MGVIYDGLDEVTKQLANTLVETKGMEKELAAIAAKSGAGSETVIMDAINTAKATGTPDKNMQAAAQLKAINGELEDVSKQYNDAVKAGNLRALIPLKNSLAKLNGEKATLELLINAK
jgi:hypothetical protein